MKTLDLAMLELEDLHGNTLILDLFDFSTAYPLYEMASSEKIDPPARKMIGSIICLRSGLTIKCGHKTTDLYEYIQQAQSVIRSGGSPVTTPDPAAAGPSRMEKQQADNERERESGPSTPTTGNSGSDEPSSSTDTDS